MKHFLVLASALLLTLTSCAVRQLDGFAKTPMDAELFDVLTQDTQEHFEGFAENFPVRMTVRYDQIYPDAVVEDEARIRGMYDAIAKIRISAKTNLSVTDAYNSVSFETADGASFGLSFEHHILCVGADHYELTSDGDFWALFAQIAEDCYEQSLSENAVPPESNS